MVTITVSGPPKALASLSPNNSLQLTKSAVPSVVMPNGTALPVAIGGQVAAESVRAQAAELVLQTNINNEATARSNADITLQTNINNEATARSNADTTLQTNINNEATARSNADALLVPLSQKGAPSGVAPLDSNSRVPEANLPADLAQSALAASFALIDVVDQTVHTSAFSAVANTIHTCDSTSGAITVTLPTAPIDRTVVSVKDVSSAPLGVTINCGGSDVVDKPSGPTSTTLKIGGQAKTWQYDHVRAVWVTISDDLPLSQLDTRYSPFAFLTNPAISPSSTDNTAAIQSLINAVASSVFVKVGMLPAGDLIVNGTLTWPVGVPMSLRGQGWGVAGDYYATRLRRTTGTQPLIQFVGTADDTAHRVIPDLRDMEIYGSDLGGVLAQIARSDHLSLNNFRVAHNEGGIGLQLTNVNDMLSSGALNVEFCGGTGSITATTTNGSTTLTAVSSFTNIIPGTVLTGTGLRTGCTVVSTNPGAGTLVVDFAASSSNTSETITWINPAHVIDSTYGDAGGSSATVYIPTVKYQQNYGTDLRITGSIPDSTPATDVSIGLMSLEGNGAGTSGSPDTYPFIDLDYANNCRFPSTRISIPTGRAPIACIQQNGTSAGTRANMFGLLTTDIAGTSQPTSMIDIGVGSMTVDTIVAGSSTLWASQLIRIRGSVGVGRFKIGRIFHNSSAPYAGFITDERTIPEDLSKGRLIPTRISGSWGTSAQGNFVVYTAANSVDTNDNLTVPIPKDADPNGQIRLRITWTGTVGDATKNVFWRAAMNTLDAGGALSTAGTNYDMIVAAPGTAGALVQTTWTSGPTTPPGGSLSITLQRHGGNASDTYTTGTVQRLAIEVLYDRR